MFEINYLRLSNTNDLLLVFENSNDLINDKIKLSYMCSNKTKFYNKKEE